MLFLGGRDQQEGASGGSAPAFSLPTTAGGSASLSGFRGRDVLLYFNEGVGCDACFYQMTELEQNAELLAERGLEVLPIVVNPVEDTRRELARFGISTPYLIDADTSVSAAYGVLDTGMHAGLPGHTFVLVGADGEIRWQRNYPSMFVETEDLLARIDAAP